MISESRRLAALQRSGVLDTAAEPMFDAITAAAAEVCETPIALVSLVDSHRQWFKSNLGLPGVTETPRDLAFCDYAIRDADLMHVSDATLDARFAKNLLVTGDPKIRFYAGMPISLAGGERIGTVCVIDRVPRKLDVRQLAALQSLARIAAACLAARTTYAAAVNDLSLSETRFRAIVDDQSELISQSRPDGHLTFVNAAYARHFHLVPEQMIGQQLLDFVDPADRELVQDHLEDVCERRQPKGGINRMITEDGRACWVAWSNRPLFDDSGHLIGMQSVGRDITAQREAEVALQASEQRYRSLYEATPAILHSIDGQGRLLDVSDQWLSLFGYGRDEVIGRSSADFLAPASAKRAREEVLPAFYATGRCDRVAYQFVHKNGSLVDVLLSATLERDLQGRPLRSLAVLLDMTETLRIAAELGRTHAQLDAIVDNVPALIGHWDQDGVTRFANRELQAALGLPTNHILGHSLAGIFEKVDPMAYQRLIPHLSEVLQGQRQEFEMAMLTTAGLRQLKATMVPDQAVAGEVTGFFGMAYDITGRKALELRLTDSEQRYRSLFENLNSGFALHEIVRDGLGKPVNYRFLAMNEAFAALCGLTANAALGRLVTDVLPGIDSDPADWIGVFGQVAQSGVPARFEQHSASLDRWFEVVAYRPAPNQFAVIAQDVTQRRQAEHQLRQALGEKETLLKEVYHRVKNNLQVVQSLLNLQRRGLPAGVARAALDDSVQRIRAMALVHEKLYRAGNLSAVPLADYAADLLKQIDESTGAARRGIRLRAEIGAQQAALDSAIPFGLLVAELVGNALKHGFGGRDAGQIVVRLDAADGGQLLTVMDDGVGLPEALDLGSTNSMGLQLAASLARQLGGELATVPGPTTVFHALLKGLE